MPAPAALAIGIPTILSLAQIATGVSSAKKQRKFQEEQLEEAKKNRRRNAIERAIGSGISPQRESNLEVPNLTNEAIVGGMAGLGQSLAPEILKAIERAVGKSSPPLPTGAYNLPPQIPTA